MWTYEVCQAYNLGKSIKQLLLLQRIWTQQAHVNTTATLLSVKKPFNREKPHCNVGTIGHFQHGKTTLTSAITKVLAEENITDVADVMEMHDLDKSPEERKRKRTVQEACIDYETLHRHYAHSDNPGFCEYIKNTAVALSKLNGTILVVSAVDGVLQETKNHLQIAKHFGVEDHIVYINKVDKSDPEMNELVEMEVRDIFDDLGMKGRDVPVIFGSALCAVRGNNDVIGRNSILELIEAMDSFIKIPNRDNDEPFLFFIDHPFTVTDHGTVAFGRMEKGVIAKGTNVQIVGHGKSYKSTVVNIEAFNKYMPEARAGDICNMQLKNVKKDNLKRGMALTSQKNQNVHNKCVVKLQLLKEEVASGCAVIVISKSWSSSATYYRSNCSCDSKENFQAHFEMLQTQFIEEGQRVVVFHGIELYALGVVSKMLPDQC